MKIAIASDHAGFELKQILIKVVEDVGEEIDDLGADQSFFDYEHPLVLVYRKTHDLGDEQWHALFREQLKTEPQVTREGDTPPVQLPIP